MTSRYQPEAYDVARDRVWERPGTKTALNQASVTPAFIALEILILTLTCLASDNAYHAIVYQNFAFTNRSIDFQSLAGLGVMMAGLHAALLRPYGSYRMMTLASDRLEIIRPFLTWTLVFLFFSAVAFTLKVGGDFSRGSMLASPANPHPSAPRPPLSPIPLPSLRRRGPLHTRPDSRGGRPGGRRVQPTPAGPAHATSPPSPPPSENRPYERPPSRAPLPPPGKPRVARRERMSL